MLFDLAMSCFKIRALVVTISYQKVTVHGEADMHLSALLVEQVQLGTVRVAFVANILSPR